MEWADEFRVLNRTNADTPQGPSRRGFSGKRESELCRTEHMFFAEDGIRAMREMILSDTKSRDVRLWQVAPLPKGDHMGIFQRWTVCLSP